MHSYASTCPHVFCIQMYPSHIRMHPYASITHPNVNIQHTDKQNSTKSTNQKTHRQNLLATRSGPKSIQYTTSANNRTGMRFPQFVFLSDLLLPCCLVAMQIHCLETNLHSCRIAFRTVAASAKSLLLQSLAIATSKHIYIYI